jgi:hypothetical protein
MSFAPTDITQMQRNIKYSLLKYEKVKKKLFNGSFLFFISNIKLKMYFSWEKWLASQAKYTGMVADVFN